MTFKNKKYFALILGESGGIGLATAKKLAEDGMTCMLVTHEMGFAREVANHVYFTDRGRIVEHGAPGDIFASPRDPRTREFLDQVL
jgi:polar amino acid transport system ATP-binding protein